MPTQPTQPPPQVSNPVPSASPKNLQSFNRATQQPTARPQAMMTTASFRPPSNIVVSRSAQAPATPTPPGSQGGPSLTPSST